MKSISPVIAIVILLLMTIAAGGLAYLTITGFQSTAQTSSGGAVQQLVTQAQSQLKIESISGGKIYVRNTGSQSIAQIRTYIDGFPRNITCPEPMESGRVYVCELNETISDCPTGYAQIQIGSGSASGTIRVRCEQLQLEGEGYCGDGNCDPGETCGNCPGDCGICKLNLENSTEWKGPWSRETQSSSTYAINLDGDSAIEIITAGSTTDSSDYSHAQLRIWNYTNGRLNLENSTEWEGQGSSYVPRASSTYAINLDGDAAIEVITAGTIDDSIVYSQAQLRIWNCTDGKLLLENSTEWKSQSEAAAQAYSTYAINLDADAAIEIITAGTADDSYYGQLRIWNYTDGNLLLENSTEWMGPWSGTTEASSTYPVDIDSDSAIEILTAGITFDSGANAHAQLKIWNYTNGKLLLENSTEWYGTSGGTSVNSVYAINLDGDAAIEILTVGYYYDTGWTQLRIWNYTNGKLNLENSTEWYTGPYTGAYSVYPIDVDGDSAIEILTAGSAEDGTWDNGQLRIWNYTNGNLLLENSTEWKSQPEAAAQAHSIYALNLDSDSAIEILTTGVATPQYGEGGEPWNGQLRVWNYTAG